MEPRLRFVVVYLLLLTLILSACGGSSATVNSGTVSLSPITGNTVEQVTTNTPMPSPTPVPKPNMLQVGGEDNPWMEISLYEGVNEQLQEVPMNQSTLDGMGTFFQGAPSLVAVNNPTNVIQNTYSVICQPAICKGLRNGNYEQMNYKIGGVSSVITEKSTGKIVGHIGFSPFKPTSIAPSVLVFTLVSSIVLDQFMEGINQQFEVVNKKLDAIKSFLDDKEISIIDGNLKYLNGIKTVMNQRKIAPTDLESFRTQLEAVERESQQTISFYHTQVARSYDAFKQIKLDKMLFVFRSDDKINEFKKSIADYQRQSQVYLAALSVRALAAQVRSALPESRELAVSRIEEVQTDLKTWYDEQIKFYGEVEKRIPEMDGWFADSKTQDQFKTLAANGKVEAKQTYDKANEVLADTTNKVKVQMQAESLPLKLVVVLDAQGKVQKISKVVS
ncbi:MAG: hypothetical protein HXX08_09805 [Chloroflexi bacterium]|uniref:Uncharacterized protein n=1 Tax=Candidatus Chlorohelix allophototropha TaxID=3003348 RepID=A0A8T7M2E3_9CHLR|nr:hypothetical protein [Chloroflexota bacterium]WJW65539.1 hypothetical protein OZ401_001305 [Chloroflexota bacterium L227-S17]